MGKLLDEPDGVCQGDLASLGQNELPRGRVKRGKQLVIAENARIGERVEQTRFTSVGVACKRYLEHAAFVSAFALQRPHLRKLFELSLDRGDALSHHPPVDFELAFALAEP